MRNIQLLTCLLLIFILFCNNAIAEDTQFSVNAGSAFLYGSVDGYLQTPAGGHPGTTSSKRPTFDELGFKTMSVLDSYVEVNKGRHEILVGEQFTRLSGKSTLSKDLTSQNINFSAGEVVDAHIKTDWYRFNYLYQCKAPDSLGNSVTISPGAGVVLLDFHDELAGTVGKVDRSYSKLGYRLGGELNWNVTDTLSLKADAFGSLPFPNTPSILSMELQGQYQLWKGRYISGKAIAGAAFNRIDYKDEQTLPNHIRVEMGPLLEVGINLEF